MHLEVQVVVGGAPGIADEGDHLPGRNPLADLHRERGIVVVDGVEPEPPPGPVTVVSCRMATVSAPCSAGPA